MAGSIPDKPQLEGLEAKWASSWENAGTYRFNRERGVERGSEGVFAVDTPPPTASGSLHIGHVFSYTHMDLQARYQRIDRKSVV